MIRELQQDQYNSQGYSDENALARLMLAQPDRISRKLTRLWSEDKYASKFSFLAMTEGQGNVTTTNDVQYTWDIMGMMPHTSEVLYFDTAQGNAGQGNSYFKVVFPNNWIIPQYGLLAPDGVTHCYVHGEPVPFDNGTVDGMEYTLEIKTTDPNAYVDVANLATGSVWIMTAPHVEESGSIGNRSNIMAPGKMTNQTSFNRYSKVIQGNLANKVVPIQFDGSETKSGESQSLWINEEQRQFELWMRVMNNHDLYLQEYNRLANGRIVLKGRVTGKTIPIGSGVRETIKDVGNYDTYGYSLPLAKLKNITGEIFWGETDAGVMEIVIHGGTGFGEDLHDAIMREANAQGAGFMWAVGEKFVSGDGMHLSYGAKFTQYKTITGHTITFKHDAMFDTGLLGELDKKNGNLHPRTGYPMSSHTGVFMDYSVYEGERNIEVVQMKGQANISGVVKGLAPIHAAWGAVPSNSLANTKDESRYEVKQSRSINIKNAKNCFILQAVA
ncbi:MAG: hypothetical protein KAH32_07400 [Chlamydiia bacterium]|nr:hypothetical protein [Chlamydiia bacterium]